MDNYRISELRVSNEVSRKWKYKIYSRDWKHLRHGTYGEMRVEMDAGQSPSIAI